MFTFPQHSPDSESVAAILPRLLETLEYTSERFRGEERKFAKSAWVAIQAMSKAGPTGGESPQNFSILITTLLNEFAAETNTTFPEIMAQIRGDVAHDHLKRSRESRADVTMDMVSYYQIESERGLDLYKRLNDFISRKLSEGVAGYV
ncbi:hypothetical protein NCC49_003576 [Naganishia albida]|nr:hypothetical protein NCC49_003576 [Naganishia albida]